MAVFVIHAGGIGFGEFPADQSFSIFEIGADRISQSPELYALRRVAQFPFWAVNEAIGDDELRWIWPGLGIGAPCVEARAIPEDAGAFHGTRACAFPEVESAALFQLLAEKEGDQAAIVRIASAEASGRGIASGPGAAILKGDVEAHSADVFKDLLFNSARSWGWEIRGPGFGWEGDVIHPATGERYDNGAPGRLLCGAAGGGERK